MGLEDCLPSSRTDLDTFLRNKGFDCKEEFSAETSRWVWYFIKIEKPHSNILFHVVIRFELLISDSPSATYDDNHDMQFEDTYLLIYDRQMEQEGHTYDEPIYDEDTESIHRIGRFTIHPQSFADLGTLIAMLK